MCVRVRACMLEHTNTNLSVYMRVPTQVPFHTCKSSLSPATAAAAAEAVAELASLLLLLPLLLLLLTSRAKEGGRVGAGALLSPDKATSSS